jgi:hypothetical protein
VHPDRLFLETLADLEERAATDGTEYEALMIAALLRKLVLDAHPLVDEVNQQYRLKVRYRINDTRPPAVPGQLVAWNALDGLDPETAGGSEPKVVSIDGLLRQSVMISDGHVYTVRDLIAHQANSAGAVHVGPGRDAAARALRQNEVSREEAEWPMQVWNLRSIARVVLAGLSELRDAVRPTWSECAMRGTTREPFVSRRGCFSRKAELGNCCIWLTPGHARLELPARSSAWPYCGSSRPRHGGARCGGPSGPETVSSQPPRDHHRPR